MLTVCKDSPFLYKDPVHPRILVSTRIQEPIHSKYQEVTAESTEQTLEWGKPVQLLTRAKAILRTGSGHV